MNFSRVGSGIPWTCPLYPAYHVAWDAFQSIPVSKTASDTTRYIWEATQNTNTLLWYYTVFGIKTATIQQNMLATVPSYAYPSLRAYDGDYTGKNLTTACLVYGLRSMEIGWYDNRNYIHFARDSNQTFFFPGWQISRFIPNATTPNLDIQTHDPASFQTGHAVYEASSPTRIFLQDLSGSENPIQDSITSWIYFQNTAKDSNVCWNDNDIFPATVKLPRDTTGDTDIIGIHINPNDSLFYQHLRSEERRVGKECRSRW